MTTSQMAFKIGIQRSTVTQRLRKLNLYKKGYKKYTEDDMLAVSYGKHSFIQKGYRTKTRTPYKIRIIDCFLHDKNNFAIDIAKKLDLSMQFCNVTITEYLKNNKTILVESALNLFSNEETELLLDSFEQEAKEKEN